MDAKSLVANGSRIYGLDGSLSLSQVRTKKGLGEISISGNKLVGTLEKEFENKFGLYVQVCYTDADGSRYYSSGEVDRLTLSSLNKRCEGTGCKRGVWR